MTSSHDIVSNPFTVEHIRIKAHQLCRRTDFSQSDFDDLQQDMRLYLLRKAHLFDPDRGNLEAFVTNCISTWVAIFLRYRNREKRHETYKAVSLEGTPVEFNGDITSLGALLLEEDGQRLTQAYPTSPTEQFELREALDHVMEGLDPEDRDLLKHVATHGVTSAARTLNVSRRQINNALIRLRSRFKKAGLGPN
jgi:RNA polymerase sigma factor (sigma-70 family)